MIHDKLESQTVAFQIDEVIASARNISAQNFKAFRATAANKGEDYNVMYEDMVLCDDDAEALTEQIDMIVPNIYQDIRAYTPAYTVDNGEVSFKIELKDANAANRLIPLMKKIVIDKLLAWWYEARVPKLAEQYSTSASNTMAAVRAIVIPTFGVRKLRQI